MCVCECGTSLPLDSFRVRFELMVSGSGEGDLAGLEVLREGLEGRREKGEGGGTINNAHIVCPCAQTHTAH